MFRDREDAALQLAGKLRDLSLRDPLVLGIPRGGVVLGARLARELDAELDVVLARKLRAPWQPELAVGAIDEDGEVCVDPQCRAATGVDDAYLAQEQRRQLEEIRTRREVYRQARPPAPVVGRSVILTDDGVATGSTMLAALRVIGRKGAGEVIVAVPVGSPDRLAEVGRHCDRVVCILAPELFWAIGQFYGDFRPIDEEEVIAVLRRFAPPDESTG